MELKEILAISGKPGLYRLISSNASRLVVESIGERKKMPIPATSKVSSLEDIAIFTIEEDVPLAEVFTKMLEKTGEQPAPSHKAAPEELRTFINEVLADIDHDRVYNSDLKKLFQWYNLLLEANFFSEVSTEAQDLEVEVEATEAAEETKSDETKGEE